ncbi:MAG: SGNH/GDSL hydrolase family protein [Woeseiaceae bacterium]|jgi:lysophospholipase L1-like esterase
MKIRMNALWGAWLVVVLLAAPAASAADEEAVRYYVSLGTSLAAGVQPDAQGINQVTDDSYADQLFGMIQDDYSKLKLVKLGCPGETTVTMMDGGLCEYPKKSQLAEAVSFLHAHKDKVELVSIDIGVNDILAQGCIVGTNVDFACINDALVRISENLPVILGELRAAAHPDTQFAGMNYYNSFLAFWLQGPEGQVLAHQSAALAEYLNYGVLGPIYGLYGMPVADVAAAFNSSRFDISVPFPPPYYSAPLNVATICQLTYMCVPAPIGPNIHANPTGYAVIAAAFDDVIP